MSNREDGTRSGQDISRALQELVAELESRGLDRGLIGAGMIGVGASIVAEREGREVLFQILEDARLAVEADGVRKN